MTWAKALIAAVVAVFMPIKAVILTVGALTFADTAFGVMAAKKRGEKITSAGLGRSMVKLFVYECAIMLGYLCQNFLTGDEIPIVKIASSYIGLVELKSILESADEVNGQSIFKSLISKLGSQNDESPKT